MKRPSHSREIPAQIQMRVRYATDGSEPAIAPGVLLEKVAARDRVEVEVTVLSVVPAPPPASDEEAGRAEAVVEAAVERLLRAGFVATGLPAQGYPGWRIVEEVEREGYDLTMVGPGTESWLGRLLLGSVSTRVLHAAPTPVLVVHGGSGGP